MQYSSIGSGSKGNGTLVRHNGTTVLIDCGFGVQETQKRLARLGIGLEDISAILVTHEHGDHAKGVGPVARKGNIPVYMTHGTFRGCKNLDKVDIHWIIPDSPFRLGSLDINPVTVPHDAREPCQFVIGNDAGGRIGILTDCGHITRHIVTSYAGCNALLLECNHDTHLLSVGAYPPSLKVRVGGDYGHLNNHQSIQFLQAVDTRQLQQVCITHISENNNDPELVRDAVVQELASDIQLTLADQSDGLPWHEIDISHLEGSS